MKPRAVGRPNTGDNLRITDISSNHLNLLTWALERQGKDPRNILGEIGVSIPAENDPLGRIPLVTMVKALEHIQQASGDPCAGLKLYGHMKLAHLNVLGFALSCSSTLLDFFERARRFSLYLSSAFMIDFAEQEDHFLISGRWSPDIYDEQIRQVPNAHLLLECAGYSALSMLQEAYGEALPLIRLFLPGQPHEQVVEAFAQAAKCPIVIGGDYLGAELAKDVFTRRLPGANPQLARVNDEQLIEHLATIEQTDLVHRCEKLILDGISAGGHYSLKDVARALGMSERGLKQNLRDHGQSFSGIVSHIKKTLAIQHLREGKKNVSQIAYLLGFDSPSNFSRAFRSWTGCSPRDYKRHQ